MKKIYAISFLTVTVLALPLLAGAQQGIAPVPVTSQNIGKLIDNVLNFVFGLFIAIAVLFIIYAAYLYLTSGGDEEKTKESKKWIWATIIALVIAFLARTVVAVVRGVLGF